MPGIARDSGTDSAGGPLIAGSSNVFANFLPAVRVGDAVAGHGKAQHAGPRMASGSSTVFVNNIAVCRSGDKATCGHTATGSSNVFADGGGGGSGVGGGGNRTVIGPGAALASSPYANDINQFISNYLKQDAGLGTGQKVGDLYARDNPGIDPYKDPNLIAQANQFLSEDLYKIGVPAALGMYVIGANYPTFNSATGAWYNVFEPAGTGTSFYQYKVRFPDGTSAYARFDDNDITTPTIQQVLDSYTGSTSGQYGLVPGQAVDAYNSIYNTDWTGLGPLSTNFSGDVIGNLQDPIAGSVPNTGATATDKFLLALTGNGLDPNFKLEDLSPQELERQRGIAIQVLVNGGYGEGGFVASSYDRNTGALIYVLGDALFGEVTRIVFPDGTRIDRIPNTEDVYTILQNLGTYNGPKEGTYGISEDRINAFIVARNTTGELGGIDPDPISQAVETTWTGADGVEYSALKLPDGTIQVPDARVIVSPDGFVFVG